MFVGFRLAVTTRFEVRETMRTCIFLDCDLDVDGRVISHLVESLRKVDLPGNINRSMLATELPKRVQ